MNFYQHLSSILAGSLRKNASANVPITAWKKLTDTQNKPFRAYPPDMRWAPGRNPDGTPNIPDEKPIKEPTEDEINDRFPRGWSPKPWMNPPKRSIAQEAPPWYNRLLPSSPYQSPKSRPLPGRGSFPDKDAPLNR